MYKITLKAGHSLTNMGSHPIFVIVWAWLLLVNSYLFKQHPLTILDGMHGDLYVFPQFLSDIHFCAYLAQKLEIIGLSTYRISPLAGILKSMLHLVKSVPDLKSLEENDFIFKVKWEFNYAVLKQSKSST